MGSVGLSVVDIAHSLDERGVRRSMVVVVYGHFTTTVFHLVIGPGQFFVARVGPGQPFMVWV